MYILSVHMWFQNLIRQFFFNLDKVIFNFIPTMYNFLTDIARTSVLSQADIASIANRIYQLLAIFMVFKVIFSLIMYVVNPDDFSDKSKGVSKLGINIVISLSLLVLTPYIFSYAYQLQTIILEDDSLGTLVFGDINSEDKSIFNSAGDNIAYTAMSPFFLPNTSIDGLGECSTLTVNGKFNEKCSGLDLSKEPDEMVIGDSDTLAGLAENKDAKASFTVTDITNYVYGVERQNLALMFRQEVVLATADVGANKSNEHVFDYKFIFSTAVGVVIVFLLISFSMDVAVRSIKLSFLQLISPIPILSYIDPKSGKDGMFKKWYQLCFKTYVSLFVRLLALYFGIFIITKIDKISDVVDGSYQTNMFVKIFVIIGVLMFVKQLPKMLEGLGIKLDGDGKFTLNPLKKFGEEALGGKKILGFGAAAGAAGLAGATNFASRMFHPNSWKDEKGRFSLKKGLGSMAAAPGSAIAGAASAMWRGGKKAMHDEKMGKIFGDSYGEAMFAKLQREDLERQGSSLGGRILADFNRRTGNLNAAQNQELWAAQAEQEHTAIVNKLKNRKEEVQRRKDNIAREKSDKQRVYTKRKTGYEGMKNIIDGFKTTYQEKNATTGKIEQKSINVKDALEQKQKMLDNGNYTVKVGQQYTVKDAITGKDVKKIATTEDVARGVKTDEAKALDAHIKEQQNLAYKYLTSTEGKKTVDGQKFEINANEVSDTLAPGEKIAESYDEIKDSAMTASKNEQLINDEYRSREEDISNELINISDEEAKENERYIKELEELGLDKDSPEWKKNEADHKARKIGSGQKQPEGFKPSANNAYSAYNTNFVLGNGPGGNQPPGPGGPHGPGPNS